jgi:hypothetical protein
MMLLKTYEVQVVRLLTSGILSPEQCEAALDEGRIVSYEQTGSGYFLCLSHPSLPQARTVCHRPIVTGHHGNEDCGFVIFIEKGQLVLECHTWGEVDLSDSCIIGVCKIFILSLKFSVK